MPKIQKISINSNVLVFLDSGETLRISYESYSNHNLQSNMEIDQELYLKLSDESCYLNCLYKALSYLGRSSKSIAQMRIYLTKKGFPEKIIQQTIEYLMEKNYLNDYNFALHYIKNKIASGKKGALVIKSELIKKGVNRHIIEEALQESNAYDVDMDALYEMALKKYKSIKDKDNAYGKIFSFLINRGFDYRAISSVLQKLKLNNNE